MTKAFSHEELDQLRKDLHKSKTEDFDIRPELSREELVAGLLATIDVLQDFKHKATIHCRNVGKIWVQRNNENQKLKRQVSNLLRANLHMTEALLNGDKCVQQSSESDREGSPIKDASSVSA